MPTKGRTLRVQRVRVGVTQTALAKRMGHHRNSVIGWEKQAEVPADVVERYLAALDSFRQDAVA